MFLLRRKRSQLATAFCLSVGGILCGGEYLHLAVFGAGNGDAGVGLQVQLFLGPGSHLASDHVVRATGGQHGLQLLSVGGLEDSVRHRVE